MARPELNGHIAAVAGHTPRGYKPFRDRAVHGRTAPCPDCKAQVDQPCVHLVTGEPQNKHHQARRRMALRAEREAQA